VRQDFLDLRVRVLTGLDKDHVVAARVEYRLEHAEYFGVAIDDNDFLYWRYHDPGVSHLRNPPFLPTGNSGSVPRGIPEEGANFTPPYRLASALS
jgi:hypothetical protein